MIAVYHNINQVSLLLKLPYFLSTVSSLSFDHNMEIFSLSEQG